MSIRIGFKTEPMEGPECTGILEWVNGKHLEPPAEVSGAVWLLAHCDAGIVWGKREAGSTSWQTSHSAFPEVSPQLVPDSIQEIRVFDEETESLIWRTDDGFRGRVLADATEALPEYLTPQNQEYLINADRVIGDPKTGFSLVGDARGSRQAVPIECTDDDFPGTNRWPLRLSVRHYMEEDLETGAIRIATTRLCKVWKA